MPIYIPYFEMLWRHFPHSLEEIKKAGFEGIECHLIGTLRKSERVAKLRQEVSDAELCIRFHQGWSRVTGQRNFLNKWVLGPMRILVPTEMLLLEQMWDVGQDPVVIYGNHLMTNSWRENYLYQTASEHIDGREYAVTFEKFVAEVKRLNAPVVFDTQHILEWSLNQENVKNLPTNYDVLVDKIAKLWYSLAPYVREIHLCDFDPRLGFSRGRNVFLGKGVFPLMEFGSMVRDSRWRGVITPEVNPLHMSKEDNLERLYAVTKSLMF